MLVIVIHVVYFELPLASSIDHDLLTTEKTHPRSRTMP